MNNNTKAVVTTVDLGFAKIQGLMLPNGSYAIAVPQLAEVLRIDKGQASRSIKSLLGKDFQFDKTQSELNPKPVNILLIEQVSTVIYRFAKKGNAIADSFVEAILVEGLERRFDKAFGKQVEEDERNKLIALRMKRILARKLWTDVLRDRSIQLFGIKPTNDDYRNWTVIVNERLFGRKHFNCDRDNMESHEQETIELFERMAERKAQHYPGATPEQLIQMALGSFE